MGLDLFRRKADISLIKNSVSLFIHLFLLVFLYIYTIIKESRRNIYERAVIHRSVS